MQTKNWIVASLIGVFASAMAGCGGFGDPPPEKKSTLLDADLDDFFDKEDDSGGGDGFGDSGLGDRSHKSDFPDQSNWFHDGLDSDEDSFNFDNMGPSFSWDNTGFGGGMGGFGFGPTSSGTGTSDDDLLDDLENATTDQDKRRACQALRGRFSPWIGDHERVKRLIAATNSEELNTCLVELLSARSGDVVAVIPKLRYNGSTYKNTCKSLFNERVFATQNLWTDLANLGVSRGGVDANNWPGVVFLFGVFAGSSQEGHARNLLRGLCRGTTCPTEERDCMRDCVQTGGAVVANSLQRRYATQAAFVRRIAAELAREYAPPSGRGGRRPPVNPAAERGNAFRAMRDNARRIAGSDTKRNTFATCMTFVEHALESTDENEANQCFGVLKKRAYSGGFIGIEEKWSKHVVEGFLARGNSAYAQKALEVLFKMTTRRAEEVRERLLRDHPLEIRRPSV
ncbi:MAG: hypothetical protein AAF471_04875 [Myxococcota bacterium]